MQEPVSLRGVARRGVAEIPNILGAGVHKGDITFMAQEAAEVGRSRVGWSATSPDDVLDPPLILDHPLAFGRVLRQESLQSGRKFVHAVVVATFLPPVCLRLQKSFTLRKGFN
jgi:hypothetical protein